MFVCDRWAKLGQVISFVELTVVWEERGLTSPKTGRENGSWGDKGRGKEVKV